MQLPFSPRTHTNCVFYFCWISHNSLFDNFCSFTFYKIPGGMVSASKPRILPPLMRSSLWLWKITYLVRTYGWFLELESTLLVLMSWCKSLARYVCMQVHRSKWTRDVPSLKKDDVCWMHGMRHGWMVWTCWWSAKLPSYFSPVGMIHNHRTRQPPSHSLLKNWLETCLMEIYTHIYLMYLGVLRG